MNLPLNFLVPGLNPCSTEKLKDILYLHKKNTGYNGGRGDRFSWIFKSARNLI